MADLQFSISATSETPARTRVRARGFEFLVDEPPSLGGTDHGPNPVETLLGAYAGCLNVVAHLVAKEHKLELQQLSILVEGELNPERLFGSSDMDRAGFKQIRVTLETSTLAPQETLQRWADEVVRRCPVGDNLKNATPVDLRVEARAEQQRTQTAPFHPALLEQSE